MGSGSDEADRKQPFLFSMSIGEFLESVAFFFICVALGYAVLDCYGFSSGKSTHEIEMLCYAIAIFVLLEINSKILYGLFAVCEFFIIVFRIIMTFYNLADSEHAFDDLSWIALAFVILFIVFSFATVILAEAFCAAALLKLSGVLDKPEPPKTRKRKSQRRASESVESGRSQKSCSHSPTCSKTSSSSTKETTSSSVETN